MKKGKKLSERIEKERLIRNEVEWNDPRKHPDARYATIPSAAADAEIAPYLDNFVTDVKNIGPLPKTDLTTPESARAALYMLNEKLEQLERYRKTAQALKSLLLNQNEDVELN